MVFGRAAPLATSLGINFYRGHNTEAVGNWSNPEVSAEIRGLPATADFELKLSDVYLRHGLEAMQEWAPRNS